MNAVGSDTYDCGENSRSLIHQRLHENEPIPWRQLPNGCSQAPRVVTSQQSRLGRALHPDAPRLVGYRAAD